ncbi:MAG: helix-turn-helix domain-containing protein, partial [Maribacter sp.]
MSLKKTDITLNGYLPSLLNGLENDGININKFLKNPVLRKLDLYDPDGYIPNQLLETILVDIKDDLGLNNFYKDLNPYFKSTKMGKYSMHIFQSPNFLTFLKEVIKYQKNLRTNYDVKLNVFGSVARFSVKILEVPSKGKLLCEEIDMIRIIDAFKLIGGEQFIPTEIGITGSSSKNIESILPNGNYKLQLKQVESWILFNTSLLSKKIPNLLDSSSLTNIVQSQNPESYKIELLLDSFKMGAVPNMAEIADMFNVSRRTLERNLLKEGSSFSIIKDKYLQRKSFELLQDPDISVKEIAEQLNFSNTQNYIRSFKRWTTVSPETFRTKPSQVVA